MPVSGTDNAYGLTVTATDPKGHALTSTMTVTVDAVFTNVAVVPATTAARK